ncbi:hypothetical protein EWM64_g6803 [Hericium alpestre]|uniref:Transposase Tc1-like domain-containing protein n=1 Tax=Hericium alpestre TaxID=135208 RepID=A0A4Y9ZUL3_9AGAM|nr:hypothetical protein EWM64_g6803 [Hericium alpestre]
MPPIRNHYCHHDSPKKDRFIGAVKAGLNISQAANQENIPLPTAYALFHKYEKTGSTRCLPRSGRPPKATEHTKGQIVREARKYRRKPFAALGKSVEPPISESTVRRILSKEGYHRRVARRVPYLTPEQKKARLTWAQVNRRLGDEDWRHIIWSDECYIYIGGTPGRIYVTRRSDEILQENSVVPTFKQSPVRVMVWGCIMWGKKGPLVVLEYPGGKGGGMNSQRYKEQVLEPFLKDFYKEMVELRGSVKFQQDNSPSHTSKSTKLWLTSHSIETFPHPSSSPDLSPIEPVWHELKVHIHALPHLPNTLDQLKVAVYYAWNALTIEDINKHVRHMSDRVEAVLKAKGGHTGF